VKAGPLWHPPAARHRAAIPLWPRNYGKYGGCRTCPMCQAMRRCLPGTFDEAVTRLPARSRGARVIRCRPGSSPPSLVAAMALTGANVAFGKVIAERSLCTFRALPPCCGKPRPGPDGPLRTRPPTCAHELRPLARRGADGNAGAGRGVDAGGPQAHGRGRRRHNHGDLARRGGGAGRALCRRAVSRRLRWACP
jgi:hypothetical protein